MLGMRASKPHPHVACRIHLFKIWLCAVKNLGVKLLIKLKWLYFTEINDYWYRDLLEHSNKTYTKLVSIFTSHVQSTFLLCGSGIKGTKQESNLA